MWTRDAWERAAECAARAEKTTDGRCRDYFARLRDSCNRVLSNSEFWKSVEPAKSYPRNAAVN